MVDKPMVGVLVFPKHNFLFSLSLKVNRPTQETMVLTAYAQKPPLTPILTYQAGLEA